MVEVDEVSLLFAVAAGTCLPSMVQIFGKMLNS
jgi:hypothetical protein